MESAEKGNPSVTTYKTAAFAATGMILFFLVMKLLGLVTIVEFRFLNFFIMFLGIRHVLLQSRATHNGKLEYLTGMLAGFLTALYTSLMFATFIFIYLSIDHSFMQYLVATQPFGSYLTPASAALVTVIEGVAGGAILSFAMMHLYNRDNNPG